MLRRLQGLFIRYADRHFHAVAPGVDLWRVPGDRIGRVERVELAGRRLRLAGWSAADEVALSWPGGEVRAVPQTPRPDVAAAHGVGPETGFDLTAPFGRGPFSLRLRLGSDTVVLPFAGPGGARLFGRRLGLGLRFAADLARAAPAVAAWAVTRNPVHRARVKSRLGLDTVAHAGGLDDAAFLSDASWPDWYDGRVTVVLPVHNAFDLLPEVLDRLERHTDVPWHLIVVEDGSTDGRVRPFLRDWAGARPERVTLLENEGNLGFIGSVNRAFELAIPRGDHVLLLNSDAFLPQGWASRLLAPLAAGGKVASVTPMSNDAEIFTAPQICRSATLAPGVADLIDRAARHLDPARCAAEAPTGVGFCMAIHIAALTEMPRFDSAFGRGYGEEVDWCQKLRALGWRHLGLGSIYVEHRGGQSFGPDRKAALVLQNNAIISTRYPGYDAAVQDFIRTDPLLTPRLALAVAHLAAHQEGAVPVYLAHMLGGGAEDYLQARIARDLSRGGGAIVLRVGGPQTWQIEVRSIAGDISGGTDRFTLVRQVLGPVRNRRVIYSCGVGHPDPMALPEALRTLAEDAEAGAIEVLIHDFLPLSPSYCLLDSDGVFRGVPGTGTEDVAHVARRPGNAAPASLAEWRAAWGRLLRAAERITVFSEDSRDHVLTAYPGLSERIAVTPHDLLSPVPRAAARPDGAQVVGVLGNIGRQKGAAVLAALARGGRRANTPRIVVIGTVDPAFALPSSVTIHGPYRREEIADLAARYGITDWLIPSIWPETFSYTTHEALATGLPVHAFEIGAQGAAVAAAENGRPVPYDPTGDPAAAIRAALARGPAGAPPPRAESGADAVRALR